MTDDKVSQRYNAEAANIGLQYIDLTDPIQISAKLNELQGSLDLEKGRVAAAAYIRR